MDAAHALAVVEVDRWRQTARISEKCNHKGTKSTKSHSVDFAHNPMDREKRTVNERERESEVGETMVISIEVIFRP
jgi:hypothetical protein